jgi:hypothetical protein
MAGHLAGRALSKRSTAIVSTSRRCRAINTLAEFAGAEQHDLWCTKETVPEMVAGEVPGQWNSGGFVYRFAQANGVCCRPVGADRDGAASNTTVEPSRKGPSCRRAGSATGASSKFSCALTRGGFT